MSETIGPQKFYNPDKEGGGKERKYKERDSTRKGTIGEEKTEQLIKEGIDVRNLSPEEKAKLNRERVQQTHKEAERKRRERDAKLEEEAKKRAEKAAEEQQKKEKEK